MLARGGGAEHRLICAPGNGPRLGGNSDSHDSDPELHDKSPRPPACSLPTDWQRAWALSLHSIQNGETPTDDTFIDTVQERRCADLHIVLGWTHWLLGSCSLLSSLRALMRVATIIYAFKEISTAAAVSLDMALLCWLPGSCRALTGQSKLCARPSGAKVFSACVRPVVEYSEAEVLIGQRSDFLARGVSAPSHCELAEARELHTSPGPVHPIGNQPKNLYEPEVFIGQWSEVSRADFPSSHTARSETAREPPNNPGPVHHQSRPSQYGIPNREFSLAGARIFGARSFRASHIASSEKGRRAVHLPRGCPLDWK